jgi:hypothetical protein
MSFVSMSLGDRDEFFAWLDRAYEERSFDLTMIRFFPDMDAETLADPRLDDLLRRINYPGAS